jgi:molybdate transport system substrate-binding protein
MIVILEDAPDASPTAKMIPLLDGKKGALGEMETDAVAAPDLKTIEIPAELNVIAKYPIAPLAKSVNADLAMAFINYVLSPDSQAVLQKWGFAPPAK